jgi:very-short-patch-repair endonuclease
VNCCARGVRCAWFAADRERDAILTRAGYRTLRFAHRRITNEPGTVAVTISAAMSDRRAA